MDTDPADLLTHPHLFRHRYDIDTLIAALCTGTPNALHTGLASFPLEALPASFLPAAPRHASFTKLPADVQQHVQVLASQPLATLPGHFGTPAGDWLRERVKDAALDWLDAHNLIPPSMRHVPRQTRSLQTPVKKVIVQ